MSNAWQTTLVSGNRKTGPISTTMTTSDSCPDACPLKRNGCYADYSFVGMHWRKLDKERGLSLKALCAFIKKRATHVWRYAVAGDLPGEGDSIDTCALIDITEANRGKRGFTYTHKPVLYDTVTRYTVHRHIADGNRKAIERANKNGFTINLSANDPNHADALYDLEIGPVVCLLPEGAPKQSKTPKGRCIAVCPAEYAEIDCARCQLCAKANRKVIVGFRAHSSGKGKANAISKG